MTTPTSEIVIPVAPVPASRPKVSKFGTYYTATYAKYRKEAHTWASKRIWHPTSRRLIVSCEFVCLRPRTSKLDDPKGDVDNYVKAALDVLNERAWEDDKQIIWLLASKRFAEPNEEPHTVVNLTVPTAVVEAAWVKLKKLIGAGSVPVLQPQGTPA